MNEFFKSRLLQKPERFERLSSWMYYLRIFAERGIRKFEDRYFLLKFQLISETALHENTDKAVQRKRRCVGYSVPFQPFE
jgi:hypothetical protein